MQRARISRTGPWASSWPHFPSRPNLTASAYVLVTHSASAWESSRGGAADFVAGPAPGGCPAAPDEARASAPVTSTNAAVRRLIGGPPAARSLWVVRHGECDDLNDVELGPFREEVAQLL